MKFTSCGAVGRLHAFCLTDDGAILHSYRQEGGEWSQWQRSHPDTFADVSCATVGDDIHVIALTQTGITVHSILTAQGHWQGFQQLPQQPIMEE
jgi:hypothetical protein